MKEVFTSLLHKFDNQTLLGAKVGLDQSQVSKVRATGNTSMQVLLAAAELDGRAQEEIRARVGTHAVSGLSSHRAPDVGADPPFASLLAGVGEMPGFRAWMHERADLRVSQVNAIVEAFFRENPECDPHGPMDGGWDAFSRRAMLAKVSELKRGIERARRKTAEPSPSPPGVKTRSTRSR